MAEKTHISDGEKKIEKYIIKLKRMLGKGAYAEVFLGRTISSGEPVAVKVIDKKIFANHYNLKNIQSEIEIMKKVEHKNVVKMLDVYQTANNMYIITEFCDEGDLSSLLKKRKKLPEKEAVQLLRDILQAFKYLVSLGITHRDLKPANILMKNGRCKVSDFGFAKNLEYGENTIMKSIVGTPLYMSPQILNKGVYTNKSDVWSVGLIFYEMLHGYTPWPAQNEMQLVHNILTRAIVFDPSVSEKSRDFIKQCLRVKEEDRMSWEEAFLHPVLSIVESPARKDSHDEKENYNANDREPRNSNPMPPSNRDRSRSAKPKREQRDVSLTKVSAFKDTDITRTPRSKLDKLLGELTPSRTPKRETSAIRVRHDGTTSVIRDFFKGK